MDDYKKLERLLADGYLVEIDAIALSTLNQEGARFFSNVSTQLTPETLLDPSNRAKFLVRLINPSTGNRVDLLTSDEHAISRAKDQLRYQREPVETFISVICAALGGSSAKERVFHLDRMVASLDGIWGWKLTLGEILGTFRVKIRIESMDKDVAEEALENLQLLLHCLAVMRQVGFYIQHYSFESTPRCTQLPYFGATGPEEMMMAPVTHQEIDSIKATLSSRESMDAARGLNDAYCENTMASRLSRLWATAEGVFGSKPQPLLNEEEIKYLVAVAEGIESLSKDSDRLKKFKDALPNPFQLPLQSRNRLMAEAIAPIMGISDEEAHSKVSTASELRGKHGHGISRDLEGMEASEKFLQEALRRYLAQ